MHEALGLNPQQHILSLSSLSEPQRFFPLLLLSGSSPNLGWVSLTHALSSPQLKACRNYADLSCDVYLWHSPSSPLSCELQLPWPPTQNPQLQRQLGSTLALLSCTPTWKHSRKLGGTFEGLTLFVFPVKNHCPLCEVQCLKWFCPAPLSPQ
jgi:hypothetical protein